MTFDVIDSPVGRLIAGASHDALQVLEFSEPATLDARLAAVRLAAANQPLPPSAAAADRALLEKLRLELEQYFSGGRRTFELPLRYSGSPFQQRVWTALRTIGYGQTASYLELARAIGDDKAVRAVGQANGRNPIAIVIPCHRVVNANGDLGGFGGGPWRKQYLLDLERGDCLFPTIAA